MNLIFTITNKEIALAHWHDKFFNMAHAFKSADNVFAAGTSKSVMRSRNGLIQSAAMIAA